MEVTSYFSQLAYVNCWHMNPGESAAMWGLYLKSDEGIAVQSTVRRLMGSLSATSDEIVIGSVIYYGQGRAPALMRAIDLLFRKRKSFEHEHELRAIIPAFRELEESLQSATEPIRKDAFIYRAELKRQVQLLDGKAIAIDQDVLVENVFVAPGAPDWLVRNVQFLLDKFGLDRKATRSQLDDPI
jgi:hypothetical protein